MTDAPEQKPEQFQFALINSPEDTLVAMVLPRDYKDLEDSKLSYDIVSRLLPSAEYVDDCVIGYWVLPPEFDTPEKMAMLLIGCGFIFDKEGSDSAYRNAVPQPPSARRLQPPRPGM